MENKNLYFTQDHMWMRLEDEKNTSAYIGISNYGQENFGDIVFVEINVSNTDYKAGEVLAIIESSKIASDIYFPVDCKVLEVNTKLQEEPKLVNTDPLGEGWFVKVDILLLEEVRKQCMSKVEYERFIQATMDN